MLGGALLGGALAVSAAFLSPALPTASRSLHARSARDAVVCSTVRELLRKDQDAAIAARGSLERTLLQDPKPLKPPKAAKQASGKGFGSGGGGVGSGGDDP